MAANKIEDYVLYPEEFAEACDAEIQQVDAADDKTFDVVDLDDIRVAEDWAELANQPVGFESFHTN